MKNNISQIATTTTITGPYPFHEISHNQIAKWLPYVLDSLTYSIVKVLNRRWAVGVDLMVSAQIVGAAPSTVFRQAEPKLICIDWNRILTAADSIG